MELQVSLQMILTVCPLVFLASAVDAIAGGGGLISLPAYLLTGIPAAQAGGSNKLSASVGTLTAMIKYMRQGKIKYLPALIAAAGAAIGAVVGAEALHLTPDYTARLVTFIALPLMMILLVVRKPGGNADSPAHFTQKQLTLCAFIGFAVGFYDGFCGPGTGTILIVLFTWLIKMDAVTASGSAKLVNLSSNVFALIVHLINGNVLFMLALPAMVCSVAGGYLGASLALKKGARFVRALMLMVFAGLLIKLIWETFLR